MSLSRKWVRGRLETLSSLITFTPLFVLFNFYYLKRKVFSIHPTLAVFLNVLGIVLVSESAWCLFPVTNVGVIDWTKAYEMATLFSLTFYLVQIP